MQLFPDDYISSVYDVDFYKLYEQGYRIALFDIDNTLVPHNAPADDRAKSFFSKLNKIGFKTVFLSNNKEPRVRDFCNAVEGSGYQFLCGKPKVRAYIEALERFHMSKDEAIFFGDQIFTDVLGAKNAKIWSVMVKPVLKWKEEPQIVLKRFLEAIILLFYLPCKIIKGSKKTVPMNRGKKT